MSQEKTDRIVQYSMRGVILLGVLSAVAIGVLTLNRLSLMMAALDRISSSPTATPISILLRPMAESTRMPRPTRTPYPTYAPDRAWPTRAASPPAMPMATKSEAAPSPTQVRPGLSLPFEDSFDTGPRPEWRPVRGRWTGVEGTYTAAPANGWSLTLVGDTGWVDYAIDVDVVFQLTTYPIRIIVRELDGSYMALETGCRNTYWILAGEAGSQAVAHSPKGALRYDRDLWSRRHLRIEVKGDVYSAYVDGVPLLTAETAVLTVGRVGLAVNCPNESMPRFEDLRIVEMP